jgi:hypothetical protein
MGIRENSSIRLKRRTLSVIPPELLGISENPAVARILGGDPRRLMESYDEDSRTTFVNFRPTGHRETQVREFRSGPEIAPLGRILRSCDLLLGSAAAQQSQIPRGVRAEPGYGPWTYARIPLTMSMDLWLQGIPENNRDIELILRDSGDGRTRTLRLSTAPSGDRRSPTSYRFLFNCGKQDAEHLDEDLELLNGALSILAG